MRVVDVRALRAAVVVANRRIERDIGIDRVDAPELRVHPVIVALVEVDKRDIPCALRDLVLDPRFARLGNTLKRSAPGRSAGIPSGATLDG